MGDKTLIQWTDATWNPVTGCTKVSEGCRNCYIARTLPRHGQDPWKLELHWDRLDQPRHWKKPRMIFLSLSDLFHKDVPHEFLKAMVGVTLDCPQHTFQFLTKRPERMLDFVKYCDFPPNVWLGVSVEDQASADERIPLLLLTPAARRFISAEPLLGPIDLLEAWSKGPRMVADQYHPSPYRPLHGLDWVIVGGESGPRARPMHPEWARRLRSFATAAEIAFFFKQWGEWRPATQEDQGGQLVQGREECGYYCDPEGPGHVDHQEAAMVKVGKKKAGRLLDGREWNEFPKEAT